MVIHLGFDLGENTDPTYGAIYYYAPLFSNSAQVITAHSGSKVVFLNDDTTGIQHTASGLGTGGFPASFDNTNGFTQAGNTIDNSLTWSTGILNHGQKSQVLTVGPPGVYYFGCAFHFIGTPTPSFASMGDVIVSI